MSRLLHICVVFWACLGAAIAPAFGGMVVCSTEGGHHAIEAPHQTNCCPAVHQQQKTDKAELQETEPCEDVPLKGNDASGPQRNADASLVLKLNPMTCVAFASPAPAGICSDQNTSDLETCPPMQGDSLERLGTVILLV